jgi:small subunit ribosomal protein S20
MSRPPVAHVPAAAQEEAGMFATLLGGARSVVRASGPPPLGVPTAGGPGATCALTDRSGLHAGIFTERRRVANIKSQIKRNATNEKRRLRNKSVKSALKTSVRSFREAAASGDKDAANEALRAASRKLDKAVSKGVIHKNQAANRKSAMAKAAAQL